MSEFWTGVLIWLAFTVIGGAKMLLQGQFKPVFFLLFSGAVAGSLFVMWRYEGAIMAGLKSLMRAIG